MSKIINLQLKSIKTQIWAESKLRVILTAFLSKRLIRKIITDDRLKIKQREFNGWNEATKKLSIYCFNPKIWLTNSVKINRGLSFNKFLTQSQRKPKTIKQLR